MLAIGRGLASSPKLLMLDEPSLGMAPAVGDFIFGRLVEIRRAAALTILLVEQRVAEALEFADHAYVLEAGRVTTGSGRPTSACDAAPSFVSRRGSAPRHRNANTGKWADRLVDTRGPWRYVSTHLHPG